MRAIRLPSWATGVIGVLAVVAIWWILAVTVFAPAPGSTFSSIPTPPQVVQTWTSDGFDFYWTNFRVTLSEAGVGFVFGNLAALILAALVLVVPRLEGVVMQIAVVTYCIPVVAIGPLLIIILGGAKTQGATSATAVFLAGLSVFFTTVVGSVLGFKAADRASLDVVSVYGGTKFTQLRKVRLIAALPNILSALQIAVPAAFLGAVLGEYFGKIEQGVGPILVASQVTLNSPRVWALFLLCAIVALVGYALVGLIARFAAPWTAGKAA